MLEHEWKLAGGVAGFLDEGHHTFPYPTVASGNPRCATAQCLMAPGLTRTLLSGADEDDDEDSSEEGKRETIKERRPVPTELAWLVYAMVALRCGPHKLELRRLWRAGRTHRLRWLSPQEVDKARTPPMYGRECVWPPCL
jgi:hypothetical protein